MQHYKRRRAKRRIRTWLRRVLFLGLATGIVVLAVSATVGTGIAPIDSATSNAVSGAQGALETEPLNQTAIEREAHRAVNQERVDRGRQPLGFDDDLRDVADSHSEDMADRGYFSHESPDGERHGDRYNRAGINCGASAENIAWTVADGDVKTESGTVDHDRNETSIARGLVQQWMNSPGHREILLNGQWQSEGIGIAVTETDDGTRVYATQNFC